MPISSFPISVRSSVNLSDINIDCDLDMGSNSIIGYTPSSSLSSLFKYFTYDISIIPITPFQLWNKAAEYSQNDVNWVTKWSEILNSTLNENLVPGFKYVLKDTFEIMTNGTGGAARGYAGYSFDNTTTFAEALQTGSIGYKTVSIIHRPISYNTTVNFQVKGNHYVYYGYVKNHITEVIGKTPTTPLTVSNFPDINNIIGFFLPNLSDKIVLNSDTTLSYTQAKPTYLIDNTLLTDTFDDKQYEQDITHYCQVNKNSKILNIETITNIDITGNPIILYI